MSNNSKMVQYRAIGS